jgi:hypothetical protein
MQQRIIGTGEDPTVPRHQCGVLGHAPAAGLIEKHVCLMPAIRKVVDDQNASCPRRQAVSKATSRE